MTSTKVETVRVNLESTLVKGANGYITIAPGVLRVEVGKLSAKLLGFKSVDHLFPKVREVRIWLWPPWMNIGIVIEGDNAVFAIAAPWQRRRMMAAIRGCGFEVVRTSRLWGGIRQSELWRESE